MSDLFGQEPTALVPTRGQKAARTKASVPGLITLYHESFVERFGFKPRISGGKDGKLLKEMVATWGEAEVRRLIVWFLDRGNSNPKVTRSDYSIGALSYLAQGMMIEARGGTPDKTTAEIVDAITRARRTS